MLKAYSNSIVFAEIPDEITLAIEISECPHKCVNCHSPWLRESKGVDLTFKYISELLKNHHKVTCVCFMGGDKDHIYIQKLAKEIKNKLNLKVGVYSGDDNIDLRLVTCLDYYKVGSYKENLGPLPSNTTNQKLYYIVDNNLNDITYKFWKK